MRAALLTLLLAGPALADETLVFRPELIEACLAEGRGNACVGVAVEPCTEETEGGYTTMGWSECLDAEFRWWEARMEAALAVRMGVADLIDAETMPDDPQPRPSDVTELTKLQQAWLALRDVQCRYEELQFWGGTGMGPAGLQCQMQMTGAQALYLEGLARL
jgi:Uncharacterized protein conserved in bacteria